MKNFNTTENRAAAALVVIADSLLQLDVFTDRAVAAVPYIETYLATLRDDPINESDQFLIDVFEIILSRCRKAKQQ